MAEDKKKKKKKKEDKKVVVAEFKVSMHCNACERTVAKTISKFKGVEIFTTDMTKHKVVVTGRINPEKLKKKLKKKTGKRVEIVINKEDSKDAKKKEDSEVISNRFMGSVVNIDYLGGGDSLLYTMFSDENANACSIM